MATKTIVGNIPANVTFIYSKKKKLESYWENDALHAGWEGQEVTPAFCSDSSNLKTMETGRNWAARTWRYGEEKGQSYEYQHKNDPIVGLKIVSLEIRGEGGRAYKVLTPDNYYFDVREDVLMDTMLEVGISAGGLLNGTFVWARVGSEMKLVRVGSKLHDALIVATADRQLKKFRYGELQVGHIYSGKGADKYIFLGYVDTISCEREELRNTSGWSWSHVNASRIYNRTAKDIKNGLLLCKMSEHTKDNKHIDPSNLYGINIKTSHTFIKDWGIVDVPADIITQISEWASQYITSHSKEDNTKYPNNSENYEDSYFSYQSDLLFAVPTGTQIVIPDKWKAIFGLYTRDENKKK
jgi:hypothetical protein